MNNCLARNDIAVTSCVRISDKDQLVYFQAACPATGASGNRGGISSVCPQYRRRPQRYAAGLSCSAITGKVWCQNAPFKYALLSVGQFVQYVWFIGMRCSH